MRAGGPHWHWLWLLWLTLPLFVWFIRRQQRNLQSMIVVFLDDLAKEWGLTRVQPQSNRQPSSSVSAVR